MADLGCRSVRRCSSLIRSAPDLFNTLNEELIIEVLKRLPLKEANRCKCVCKRWLDSISGAYFPRCYIKHRLCFPPSFALFFHYTDQGNWKVPVNLSGVQLANDVENHPVLNSPGFSLSFLPPSSSSSSSSSQSSSSSPSQPVQFLGSSNGLVLCSTSIFWQKLYYVCNPLTMHWVSLPPPPTCSRKVGIGFICIPDFDNGFSSRFKVVRIPKFGKGLHPDLRLEIFSSETGEWTDTVIPWHMPVSSFDPLRDGAVVCNGMLHWRYVYANHIFAFDPYKKANEEEFRTIALPKERCYDAEDHLFGVSQGRLRYAEIHRLTIRVWEIEDYNSGEWSLVHKLDRSEMVWEDPKLAKYATRCPYLLLVLAFHPIEGDVMFLSLPGHILEFNLRSRSLKLFCKLANCDACPHGTMFPYVLPRWPISVPQC